MTSSRRSWQKSMSKSGIDTRSGLRNRSNSRPKRSGSRSVMVSAQATTEPAPDPRPGAAGAGPRPAPGTDRDALALGPLNDVGDDQEVAGKPHPDDRLELECE